MTETGARDGAELVQVEPYADAGFGRRRRGKGWSYVDRQSGETVTDPGTLDRIKAIVVPPAWQDVWIAVEPRGHIQAVGNDAAGRRQYRYHPDWDRQRAAEKFARVARLGAVLPTARGELEGRLGGDGLGRARVMAGAVWMLDLGVFRVGGDEYADGDARSEASFGLATLRREHATARKDGSVVFSYVAKGGVPRTLTLADTETHRLVTSLKRRRGGGDDLLAFKRGRGGAGTWHDVTAEDVNDAVRELVGDEFTAKDLRTWNAGVLAAVTLATQVDGEGAPPGSERKRKKAITDTMKAVSESLGNTPAVCRSAYVDPALVTHFEQGRTIVEAVRGLAPGDPQMRARVEKAVIELLAG
jgi:DNA topoisomerase I